MMTLELFYIVFVTIFVGLVVLGHGLLIAAIYECSRDDWAVGRLFPAWPSRWGAKTVSEMAALSALAWADAF
jgi:hypothetical protein